MGKGAGGGGEGWEGGGCTSVPFTIFIDAFESMNLLAPLQEDFIFITCQLNGKGGLGRSKAAPLAGAPTHPHPPPRLPKVEQYRVAGHGSGAFPGYLSPGQDSGLHTVGDMTFASWRVL